MEADSGTPTTEENERVMWGVRKEISGRGKVWPLCLAGMFACLANSKEVPVAGAESARGRCRDLKRNQITKEGLTGH